jgi:hypothetical protein
MGGVPIGLAAVAADGGVVAYAQQMLQPGVVGPRYLPHKNSHT